MSGSPRPDEPITEPNTEPNTESQQLERPNPPNSLATTDTLHTILEKPIPIVSPDRYSNNMEKRHSGKYPLFKYKKNGRRLITS